MLKRNEFKISGIHCQSCKTLIETEVDALEGVTKINVDVASGDAEVEFDDEKTSKEEIFESIGKLNYQAKEKTEEEKKEKKRKNLSSTLQFIKGFIIPILIIVLIIGYLLIKKFGGFEILSNLTEENVSLGLIFLIGILASFHCIGMCGGLVVTYSAQASVKNKEKRTRNSRLHLQYNLGRFISYTVIGGILGGIGSFFGVNPDFSGFVIIIAGGFMILMSFSLFTRFRWIEKIKPRTPQFVAKYLYNQRHSKKPKTPLIIGLLNGFMPCGPLQAMQLYALGTGSFTQGALSMAVYSLGTIPLMFGFGSFISSISNKYINKVMKTSAVVVAILGLIMINRGLINFGYGFRGFIPSRATSQTEYVVSGNIEEQQVINMDLTYRGYVPNVLYVKKDIPVRWVINVKQMTGCTDEILLEEYGIDRKLQYGENIIEFTPDHLGEIKFSCWMHMVWGKFIVTEGDVNPNQKQIEAEAINLSQGSCDGDGSCGGTCGQVGCGCSRIK